MTAISPLQRFFRLLRPDKKAVLQIYGYGLLAGVVTLSIPLGIQAIIGLVLAGSLSSSLFILVGVVTLGTFFIGYMQVMQLSLSEAIQRRIFARSANEFALRLPQLSLSSLENEYPPELTNRFFDTLTIQKGLPKILLDFSASIIQLLFGTLLISFYHPLFVFFSIALLVTLFLVFRFTGRPGLQTSIQESKYKYGVAHWLQEIARAQFTFKMAGQSELPLSRTNELVDTYLGARRSHFRILLMQYNTIVVFKTLITAMLLGLGSYLVIQNQISIGQFVAAEIVVLLMLSSVEKMMLTMDNIYDVLTALDKIGYVADLPLDPAPGLSVNTPISGQPMQVSLRNVAFTFSDSGRPALDGIDLDVAPGENVVIAGENGNGKSTLVQTVAGLISHYSGSVFYDNIPAVDVVPNQLRRQIGYYGKIEDIFRGSLLDNLRLGHEHLSLEEVSRVVQEVGLGPYLSQFSGGYSTELLPGGRNLPRGIRSRILLARAIVGRPRLLIMEEFLDRLPADDRRDLSDMLTAPTAPWTLLAVSNDALLAERADRIVLLENGRIKKEGTFAELREEAIF